MKLYAVLVPTPVAVRALNSFVGLWMWSFLLVAHVWLDTRPATPAEMMLFVLLASEIWIMAAGLARYTPTDFWGSSRD